MTLLMLISLLSGYNCNVQPAKEVYCIRELTHEGHMAEITASMNEMAKCIEEKSIDYCYSRKQIKVKC